jgi:anti-anti-sigma factor
MAHCFGTMLMSRGGPQTPGKVFMSISSALSSTGDVLNIEVEGRFDLVFHQDFRNSYEIMEKSPAHYVVDLKATSYVDSSALGMLLLLRDFAGGDAADITVINCNDDVKKILFISKFDQLFKIP